METLAEKKISQLGKTKFTTDDSSTLAQGRAILRMEPEDGKPITFVAVTSPEEATALSELFIALSDETTASTPAAMRDYITERVGVETDWSDLRMRYDKAAETF